MRFLMGWLSRFRYEAPARPTVDQAAIRSEMTRDDPDFVRVRKVQHDALQALTAKGIRDGLAIRREREFWERHQSRG